MSALFTISGTFTALSTNLTPLEDKTATSTDGAAFTIHPNDLQNVPDEINQMIRTFQIGWGGQLGTNKRTDYQATINLIQKMLLSLQRKGLPRQGIKL
jgi:hypothetical protein